MKYEQCGETNEKSILQFLFFELQSILYSKFTESSKFFDLNNRPKKLIFFRPETRPTSIQMQAVPEKCAMFCNELSFRIFRFLLFEIWSILHSKFLVDQGLRQYMLQLGRSTRRRMQGRSPTCIRGFRGTKLPLTQLLLL